MDTSSYLFLVGRTDVEACHHDGCPWHQVEFGVGGAIVGRPESRQTKTSTSKKLFVRILLQWSHRTISIAKAIMVMSWRTGPLKMPAAHTIC